MDDEEEKTILQVNNSDEEPVSSSNENDNPESKENDDKTINVVNDEDVKSDISNDFPYKLPMLPHRKSVLEIQLKKILLDESHVKEKDSALEHIRRLSHSIQGESSAIRKLSLMMEEESKPEIKLLEVSIEQPLIPEVKERDPKEIAFVRNLPVSMKEKRMYLSGVISAGKESWITNGNGKFDIVKEKARNALPKYELWNKTLKLIEGRFGAGVVSYFLLLRFLLLMNTIIFLLNFVFIILPQLAIAGNLKDENSTSQFLIQDIINRAKTGQEILDVVEREGNRTDEEIIAYCQQMYLKDIKSVSHETILDHLQNLLQGTGFLEPTLLFLGSYVSRNLRIYYTTYHVPLAFVCVFVVSILISFFLMIQYSSFGMKEAFMARNDIFPFYANEILCTWNHCLLHTKTASLQHSSLVLALKSNLAEDRRKKEIQKWSISTKIKLYAIRFVINCLILLWLFLCFYLIYLATFYQMKEEKEGQLEKSGIRTLVIQYLSAVTIVIVNSVSPAIFAFLVSFENYHGQQQVNILLLRNVFLSLASIIVMVGTFHQQITCQPRDICGSGTSKNCRSPRCWETHVGQQLYKLTLSDLFIRLGLLLCVDIPRDLLVRKFDNKFTRLVGRKEFNLPIEVLGPVYFQTVL
ncbi:transmembrane channel-like protein 7 isoform X2 [Stegodyphus dumicola]|nr:transmembrane channel-like protein 7 isoform X2 [Stegodyphus dumicola]